MDIDPSDIDALAAFLAKYSYYTTYELAQLVDRAPSTIRKWMKACNRKTSKMQFVNSKKVSPPKKTIQIITDPEIWDTQEWFENAYYVEGHGIPTIAKIINRSVSLVVKRLERYGIQTRSYKESMNSKNPYCSEKWLMENYASKEQYVEWCLLNNETAIGEHGKGLTLAECAALADVVPYTIYNWLVKFKIPIRDINEAMVGERNPFYGRRHSDETKRKIREAQQKKIDGKTEARSERGDQATAPI